MKLGVTFGGRTPLAHILPVAQAAEKKGYQYAWVAEHLGNYDAFALACGLLEGTSNITVGTGVLSPYVRHPITIAMGAATLASRFGARVAVSLGTANPDDLASIGVAMTKPLAVVGESLDLVRGWLVEGTPKFQGTQFRCGSLPLYIKPGVPVPLFLAAIRDRMLALGGAKADGLSLSAAASPEYVRHAVKVGQAAACDVGRDPAGLALACNIILAVAPTKREGLRRAKMELARILLGGHDYLFQYQPEPVDHEAVKQALATNSMDAMDAAMPDAAADALAVCGTSADVQGGLQRLADAGLTIGLLRLTGTPEQQLATLAQL